MGKPGHRWVELLQGPGDGLSFETPLTTVTIYLTWSHIGIPMFDVPPPENYPLHRVGTYLIEPSGKLIDKRTVFIWQGWMAKMPESEPDPS